MYKVGDHLILLFAYIGNRTISSLLDFIKIYKLNNPDNFSRICRTPNISELSFLTVRRNCCDSTGNCAVKLCEIPKNSCYVHIDFQEIQIEGLEVSVTLLGCYHISSRSKHSLPLFRLL